MNDIQKHQAAILNNITGQFVEQKPIVEHYTMEGIAKYTDDLQKSFSVGAITPDVFEKGLKDLTKLQKKVITNSAGHQQTVYVRVHEDNTEHHFTHGDTVKFEHKGKSVVGQIKGLKHHDKFDPFGTAIVHDSEGNKYSKSLRAIEHHGTPTTKDYKVGDKVVVDKGRGGTITKIGTDMHNVKMDDTGDEYGIMTHRIEPAGYSPSAEDEAATKKLLIDGGQMVEDGTETDKELKKIADRYKQVDGYGDGVSHLQISKNIREMYGCSQQSIETALKIHKVPKATAKHTADPKIGGITKKITTGASTTTYKNRDNDPMTSNDMLDALLMDLETGDEYEDGDVVSEIKELFGKADQKTIQAAYDKLNAAEMEGKDVSHKTVIKLLSPKPVKGDKPLSPDKVKADDEVKVTSDETWTDKDGKQISAGDQVYHTKEGDTYHATVVGPATSDPKKIILKKNSNGEKVIVGGAKALKLMKKFKKGMEDMTDMEKAFDLLFNGFDKGESTEELITEHKKLVKVLESPSHKDDKDEAKKQKKELKEYENE